jgi:hypothetical protein
VLRPPDEAGLSGRDLDRRRFLTLLLSAAAAPWTSAAAAVEGRQGDYAADVSILYRMFSLKLQGTIEEAVDRAAGRYEVRIVGEGGRIANRIECHGRLRDGRWCPVRSTSWFQVVGREARTDLTYDWEAGTAAYRYRGETFILRRVRVAEDVVALSPTPVDDAISAVLNYADGRWAPDGDGHYRTRVVRRRRRPNEGPDDVDQVYRAELLPVVLKIGPDPESKKPTALFDMRGFSSWAREDSPARIVFGPDRRPELIASSLMLGTSITIHLRSPGLSSGG